MKPAEGWKSKAAAIKCIDSGLRSFIESHGWPTSVDKSNQSRDVAEQYVRLVLTVDVVMDSPSLLSQCLASGYFSSCEEVRDFTSSCGFGV
ncbi:MAG: hypothetical protein RR722_18420, partial [Hafnia sp.]